MNDAAIIIGLTEDADEAMSRARDKFACIGIDPVRVVPVQEIPNAEASDLLALKYQKGKFLSTSSYIRPPVVSSYMDSAGSHLSTRYHHSLWQNGDQMEDLCGIMFPIFFFF